MYCNEITVAVIPVSSSKIALALCYISLTVLLWQKGIVIGGSEIYSHLYSSM